MKKKILAMLLAAVMVMAMLPTAFAADGGKEPGFYVSNEIVDLGGTEDPTEPEPTEPEPTEPEPTEPEPTEPEPTEPEPTEPEPTEPEPTEPEPTEPETPASGKCGDNLTWTYSNGALTIEGTGPMDDYIFDPEDPESYNAPWREYCWDILTITIGDGVTSIGEFAFWFCGSMTSVTIPASVTTIGVGAFNACSDLTDINVASGNPAYTSVDGILFNADQTLLHTYPAGKSDPSYSIPASVTTIGKYAFYYQVSLTSVTIPDSVTTIDESAFNACVRLTSVTIPDSVTSIGESAFSYCINLTEVYYGGSESQWEEISIGANNEPLTNADIHYATTPEEPTEPATPAFSDVNEGEYYAEAVAWAADKGYINGYPDGTFGPNTPMQRVAVFTILARVDGVDTEGGSTWYQKAVDWVVESNVSYGENPEDEVTLEQMIVMLWRYTDKPESDISALDRFIDSSDIHTWEDFPEAMAWAVETGILLGNPDGTLKPLSNLARGRGAVILQRYYDNVLSK